LGEEKFMMKGGKKAPFINLPFSTIDLVINHKNIWGNLQNSDPTKIHYHLHDSRKWLPWITDLKLKHPLEIDEIVLENELRRKREQPEEEEDK
jgi:hypothetical protein